MRIRRLVFALPLIFVVFFLLAFLIARRNFERKLNQFVESSIGDASVLNPILSQDTASSDIEGYVFNGLVKYNQDQELIGDLAEDWTITQRSTLRLVPGGPLTAAAARERLEALDAETRQRLGLEGLEAPDERTLVLHLAGAGRAYEEELFRVLPREAVEPICFIHLELTGNEVPGWPKAESRACRQRIEAELAPRFPGRILDYHEQSSLYLVLKFLGAPEEFTAALKALLAPVTPEGKTEPIEVGEVAQTVTCPVDNEPTIAFHLRHGVRWHDGAPFTARDVEFTYQKLMDEKTNTVRRSSYELVRRVAVPDEYTFVVTYREPFSPCLETWGMGILPAHLLSGVDVNTARFNRHPVGTGPYVFKEWVSDEKITLVANPDYFEGRPFIDQITYRIIPETAMSEMEFIGGNIDEYGPAPHQVRRFRDDPRFVVYSRLGNGYTYIGWNMARPLFQDVRVRRALTMALDREAIVKYVLYDEGVLANGPFPPQMWYSDPSVQPLPYDPKEAKRLLAEAGWEDHDGDGWLDRDGQRFEFTLITNQGNSLRENVCALAYDQLKQLGIKVSISVYEWSVFLRDKIDKRDYDACVLGWSLSLDPDVYEIWHSSQREKGFNCVNYQNAEVDRLIELGRTEFDREKRRQIYFRIQKLIHDDQPYTFLYVGRGSAALPRERFQILRRPAAAAAASGYTVEEVQMTKVGLRYYFNDWVRRDRIQYAADEPRPPLPEISPLPVRPEKEAPVPATPGPSAGPPGTEGR